MKKLYVLLTSLFIVLIVASVACASEGPASALEQRVPPSGAPGASPRAPVPTAAPLPTPTPAFAPAPPKTGEGIGDSDQIVSSSGSSQTPEGQRIIVRTANLVMEVEQISSTVDEISSVVNELGGWVVSSKQTERQQAFISMRVPVERLDEAVVRIKSLAAKVDSETSTSQDFTSEYFDTQARVKNFKATKEALVKLLERAQKVEDALKVQEELTRIQEQIEIFEGRLAYLEQTSAFSLINVELRLTPTTMTVEAGADSKVREGEPVSFRASFVPPEGIEDFTYTWDFGDGSPTIAGRRTARVVDGQGRVTATVSHLYSDSEESPFIVTFTINGTGESEAVEGEDTLIVTVLEVDDISVFAGQHLTVTEGESVTFNGSFTRSQGLTDFEYRWDFGDGSEAAEGKLASGVTTATATHTYAHHRPAPYIATLRITAASEAGVTESSDSVEVRIQERPPWTAGWSMKETVRVAVLVLSLLGNLLLSILIWLGIFSPIWGIILLAMYLTIRRRKRQ